MHKIIAVASGKGGVGKSTLSVNLAACFANERLSPTGRPLNVALVDVDFYGPSIPTLMGGGEIKVDDEEKFLPALRYGIKYISIGFFLKNADDPVIWRGPMFGKAITQLFEDTNWGDVDICLVDLPPGTGDAQLSLAQLVKLNGAVVVTTPQEVALSDVRKAVNMFRKVNVDVLGVIENMSGFLAPDGQVYNVFGSGGGEVLAKEYGIPFLGTVPLDIAIRENSDLGRPAVLDVGSQAEKVLPEIARRLWDLAVENERDSKQPEIVN